MDIDSDVNIRQRWRCVTDDSNDMGKQNTVVLYNYSIMTCVRMYGALDASTSDTPSGPTPPRTVADEPAVGRVIRVFIETRRGSIFAKPEEERNSCRNTIKLYAYTVGGRMYIFFFSCSGRHLEHAPSWLLYYRGLYRHVTRS